MAYQISCSEADGFMIESDDESEVLSMIKQHASEKHDMNLSDEKAREMMHQT